MARTGGICRRAGLAAWLACLCAALMMPMPASAAARAYEPVEPWQISKADHRCQLSRRFTLDGRELRLILSRGPSLVYFDLALEGSALAGIDPATLSAPVRGDGTPLQGKTRRSGETGAGDPAVQWRFVDAARLDPRLSQDRLTLLAPRRGSITIALDRLDKGMAAWNSCHDGLLAGWGLDVDAIHALYALPAPHDGNGGWVGPDDYAGLEFAVGTRLETIVRLDSDASGTAQDCAILEGSGDADFDRLTCAALMQRASFAPAIGSDGRPTASPWVTSASFSRSVN